ncbi:C45 family peptidase [Leucobacter allii]|uniref:C45 family peptidase n=1 Tax=Leucobacter allii TaxID=2932247 RepID=A0ABY4FMN4_9MICO|nr:C45 family peptidase [Leucobacter allii]UOQ57518.1 C45 family peptidase [Leucobacter allii]
MSAPSPAGYPRIRVSGPPAERSRQYGELARERIAVIRAGYERAFAAKGIAWAEAVRIARRHLPAIERYTPELLAELRGIAEGSGLGFDEILTINCRTEVLNGASRATGAAIRAEFGECTAFAVEADRRADGGAVVGQNWDWLEALEGGVIVLEVERPDGPDYVTLVEAGLLGKMVLTEAGLALGMNTLVSSLDGVTPGVPYHLQIRSVADAPHAAGALEILAGMPRAASGNFVLADASGAVLNVESAPGGPEALTVTGSADGTLAHANHFVGPVAGGHDLAPLAMADSYARLGRMRRRLAAVPGEFGREELRAPLRDHVGFPNAVCCHPDPAAEAPARWKTLASVLLFPGARRIEYTAGPPCAGDWIELDCAELLA